MEGEEVKQPDKKEGKIKHEPERRETKPVSKEEKVAENYWDTQKCYHQRFASVLLYEHFNMQFLLQELKKYMHYN